MKHVTDQEIDAYIDLFDGDPVAAALALRERVTRQREERETSPSSVVKPIRADGPAVISLQQVSKSYKLGKQRVDALKDISLNIYKGEIVAITGPSGSGKSTLLHIIGCLDTPSTGTILIDGKDTTKLRDGALSILRRSTIGFIFQSFYLQPFLRLRDNVAVPAMFTKEKRQTIDAKTAELLDTVDLANRGKHLPKELSGGQIQRAAIARALINQPKILLADEPTGNLDTENSSHIMELFQSIRDQHGTTVVIVTHNADIARQADRIIRLRDGVVL